MAKADWISPSEAARILDIDEETVRLWARRIERGEKSRIRTAVRDPETHRILVSRSEIEALADIG